MRLYEDNRMSDERIRAYLGEKALYFAVLAGYSRSPNTSTITLDAHQLEAVRKARQVLDVHLAILDTPLDDYSANPEQRDADFPHMSDVDVGRVDMYVNGMGTVSTAVNRDEDEDPSAYEDAPFTDTSEDGLTVNDIYSYSEAASKLRRDMTAAERILAQAEKDGSMTVAAMGRLYSLMSSVRANSYVERDILGYNPFVDTTIRRGGKETPIRGDATREATLALMNMAGRTLEPTEGAAILAQQGLSIVLGSSFYGDLMSADILDKGRINTLRDGSGSNIVSRTDRRAVDDGDAFADLMVLNSRRLEDAAWAQYQEVVRLFGPQEGMAMLANVQVTYQKSLAKVGRVLPAIRQEVAERQASLKAMALHIGMEDGVDFTLDPDINLSVEDIDAFVARADVLENLDPGIDGDPAFKAASDGYNKAYMDFAERKRRLYDAMSFLADPLEANRMASFQDLLKERRSKQILVEVMNANPHIEPPTPSISHDLIVARSGFLSDVSSSARVQRVGEELDAKPRSRAEERILSTLSAIEDGIAERDFAGKATDLVASLDRDTVQHMVDDFMANPEVSRVFEADGVQSRDLVDLYMRVADSVEGLVDGLVDSADRLAQAGGTLNAEIRARLAHSQVEYLDSMVELSDEEKVELERKFRTDAVFATFTKNIQKDRVLSSTGEEPQAENVIKAEYGNTNSLVFGSACPMGMKDGCGIIAANLLDGDARIGDAAQGLTDLRMDMEQGGTLSDLEVDAVRVNLDSAAIGYYDAILSEARRAIADIDGRLARDLETRDMIRAFNPETQIGYGYEAQAAFEDFVSGPDPEAAFGRLQTLLQGIVRNNPDETEDVKKINAFLVAESVRSGSASQIATEMVKAGIVDVDTHYTLEDVRPIVDTLMVAGAENKRILADFRRTGDHTRLKRIAVPDDKDKEHFERKIVTAYNGFFQEERLEELNRRIARERADSYIARNRLESIESCSPRAYAYGDIATAAIARGQMDGAEVEMLRRRAREFSDTLLREKGYDVLLDVSDMEFEGKGKYLDEAQGYYDTVIATLDRCEGLDAKEREAQLKSVVFARNSDYAHPVQEMLRRELRGEGKMTAQEVAAASPEAPQQRYSLSVLPSEGFDVSAYKTTAKGRGEDRDRTMEDYIDVRRMYSEVKAQSIYTYPVNKAVEIIYDRGLVNPKARRSVAENERSMTGYGRLMRDVRASSRSVNLESRTFAIRNLPPTKEYIDGLKKVLVDRGVRADLVDSMRFMPSKRTNNTVVSLASGVMEKCSQKDLAKFRSTLTDIYIRPRNGGKAPKLAIVGNEGATRRVVAAIGRSYDEMSKAAKSPRAGMGAPSRAF